jgi:hypothetical protein
MNKTKANRMLAAILVASFVGLLAVPMQAAQSTEKEKVSAPKAVLTAFYKVYPGAEIKNVSMETKDSVTYYEIESSDAGLRRDLLYRSDGTIFEIEEAIAVDSLPAAVKAALKKNFPDGELQKAERITRGEVSEYEVTVENGESNLEILFDSKGVVKSQAVVSDQDEEGENSGKDEADED